MHTKKATRLISLGDPFGGSYFFIFRNNELLDGKYEDKEVKS
ncbi:hypothetical protein [Ornithinibacillus hominis]|nr:hypothetical protein [Ornithinibacillus hominis]